MKKNRNIHALLISALSMLGYAAESEAPSVEFLEFLAEFSEVNDEDFELLVHHAMDDSGREEPANTNPGAVVEETEDESN